MRKRKGYVLLGLLLFFTVLTLSSTVTVLQQDTKLKRFSEEDLKLNIDSLRRGIDLYRYNYSVSAPDASKITALDALLQTGPAKDVADLLAAESFIRARIATGTMDWKLISNLIKNPSFEIDDGTYYGAVGTWRGNFTADDNAPDGWKLHSSGAEQMISLLEPATYVISFWACGNSATAEVKVKVWNAAVPCELTARTLAWKRYFASFTTVAPMDVRLEIVRNSAVSGDRIYVDGIMLEKWDPPTGLPAGTRPGPSAWTKSVNLIPAIASEALQQNVFRDLIPQDASPASVSWWFQW